MVTEVQVDEAQAFGEAQARALTLLEKRRAADEKIKAARIGYLESQIRIGKAQLSRQVMRAVKQLEDWEAALRQLRPEPEALPVEAPSEPVVEAAVERAPVL
jgi:hypothetical protein